MPQIRLSYDPIAALSSALMAANTETVPKLNRLKDQISGLLKPGGGLWMQKSSVKQDDASGQLIVSIVAAVNGIPSFGQQYMNIVTNVRAMDEKIAASTQTG